MYVYSKNEANLHKYCCRGQQKVLHIVNVCL